MDQQSPTRRQERRGKETEGDKREREGSENHRETDRDKAANADTHQSDGDRCVRQTPTQRQKCADLGSGVPNLGFRVKGWFACTCSGGLKGSWHSAPN